MEGPIKAVIDLVGQGKAQEAAVVEPALADLAGVNLDPPAEDRRKLLAALLSILDGVEVNHSATYSSDTTSSSARSDQTPFRRRLSSQSTLTLVSTIKGLGRVRAGTEELARPRGLQSMLRFSGLSRLATIHGSAPSSPPSSRSSWEETESDECGGPDPLEESEAEAVRSLCNTLMLHPSARDVFPSVFLDTVGSGASSSRTYLPSEGAARLRGLEILLGTSTGGFLAGRLLFMLTSNAGEAIATIAESGNILQRIERFIVHCADLCDAGEPLTAGPSPTLADILKEQLKATYNLIRHYTRMSADSPIFTTVMRDSIDVVGFEGVGLGLGMHEPAGSPGLAKKARFWRKGSSAGNTPATSPGSTPVLSPTPATRKSPGSLFSRAFRPRTLSSSPTPFLARNSTPTTSLMILTPAFVRPSPHYDAPAPVRHLRPFLPLFLPLLNLVSSLPPSENAKELNKLCSHALELIGDFPLETEWSSWVEASDQRSEDCREEQADLTRRVLALFESTLWAWFPRGQTGNPDKCIRPGCGESGKAEEMLRPLACILGKLALLDGPAAVIRAALSIVNDNEPVEKQDTLLGLLVRLMSSEFLANTALAISELLYNVAGRDPSTFAAEVGAPNAKPYLLQLGLSLPASPRKAFEEDTTPPLSAQSEATVRA